jgi:hypothetical protein
VSVHKKTMRGQIREPGRLELVEVTWWKFDKYEIRNGYIRPASDARLSEYDPWAKYDQSKRFKDVGPPYLDILKLNTQIGETFPFRLGGGIVELRPGDNRTIKLSPTVEAGLLAWCSHYGLLGVLPHEFHSATLAPRWGEIGRQSPVLAVVKEFSRTGGIWNTRPSGYSEYSDFAGTRIKVPRELIGSVVPDNKIPYGCPQPHADGLRVGPSGANWIHERLGDTWGRFFPSVSPREWNTFDYPCPLTEDFWRLYSEPIDTFLRYVSILDCATQYLRPTPDFDRSCEELTARLYLEALLAPAGQIPYRNSEGRIEQRWRFPSLISALTQMAFQDSLQGRRRLRCRGCGLPHVSDAYQALYCSEQCRYKQQKRDLRARMKQAKEMAQGGATKIEIALALNETVATIRGWLKT